MKINPFLNLIASVLVTVLLSFFIGYFLTKLGVHTLIILVINLSMGFILPGKIMRWIYKEELEALKSEESKEE